MKRIRKYFLNALIIAYLGIIYFTGVPESNTLNSRIKKKAYPIALALGIWPSWSMFAPNPIRFDSKSFVEITFNNGDKIEQDVEIEPSGIFAPFRKARWMKYAQDNLRNPNQKALLDPAISYFKQKYNNKNNPIKSIKIKRKWLEVQPFSDNSLPSISKTPRLEKNEVLITQNVED